MSNDNQWKYIETEIDRQEYLKNESLMTISNGYLSLRGSYEEANLSFGHHGTYLNGFYEFYDLNYGEKFTAYPQQSQVMLNLADPKVVQVYVDDEELSLESSLISNYKRELDLQTGCLNRAFRWETRKGTVATICSTRFASSIHKHLICMKYTIQFHEGEGNYEVKSMIATQRHNISKEDDPRIGVEFKEEPMTIIRHEENANMLLVSGTTKYSKLQYNCHVFNTFCVNDEKVKEEANTWAGTFNQDTMLTLYKYIWMDKNEQEDGKAQVIELAKAGYAARLKEHQAWWRQQWESMDIVIKGDESMQKAIRLNLYHLTQNVGKDGYTNISAKAMTGEGYEGHYFWDTEIYMLPFYIYTNPDIAKALLMFRYNTLEKARIRSKQMGHQQGVLFPWRTINGEECSSFFPAGTAQYHINADIAYGIKLYYEATQDWEFMQDFGLELLLEIANLWLDIGHVDYQGRFCIHEVTGPDEYSCLVNNNTYTNIMVQDAFMFLLKLLSEDKSKEKRHNLKVSTLLEGFDYAKAKKAVKDMYVPYDQTLQIYAQDDGFLSKPVWDFKNTPKENYPLLMHYHPLTLYRHQVCKQADVVLAELLQPTRFSLEQKRRDFEYYEKITTHDSSLSNCIYGIMAAELDELDKSYEYYMKTAKTDIEDIHHNAKDGIHAANMAGAWLGIVYGFAGFRMEDNMPKFRPQIPKNWEEYSFCMKIKNQIYEVHVTQEDTKIIKK